MSYSTSTGIDMNLNSGRDVIIEASSQRDINLKCANLLLNGFDLLSSLGSGGSDSSHNWYNLPFNGSYGLLIQWGSEASSNVPKLVTFKKTYTVVPTVFSQNIASGSALYDSLLNNTTATGFTIDSQAGSTSGKPAFNWFAIGFVQKT
jgi:hypothetical protein